MGQRSAIANDYSPGMAEPTVRRGVVLIAYALICILVFLASWIFATQTDGWLSGAVGTGGGLFFTAAVALAWIGVVKVALARRGAPAPPS